MNARIFPGKLRGQIVDAIPSKSQLHRALILAALADRPTTLTPAALSLDVLATVECLRQLGAEIAVSEREITVSPIKTLKRGPLLDCGESASTLRFLLPLTAALEADCDFTGQGRLASRPLSPLYEAMSAHGVSMSPQGAFPLTCRGRLTAGEYRLAGDVSSQFFSGLMMALPLLPGESRLTPLGRLQSRPYVDMTLEALRAFGIRVTEQGDTFVLPGSQRYTSPGGLTVEGDWSAAACWLAAGAMSPEGVACGPLNPRSVQGDRAIVPLLERFGARIEICPGGVFVRGKALRGIDIDAADIPDLTPVLAVTAAAAVGDTRIRGISRLRFKESDRVASVLAMLRGLGAEAEAAGDTLTVQGRGGIRGGTVDACRDHRIAMAAAVASGAAREPILVLGAEAVQKSYPGFFAHFTALGGKMEEIGHGV